MKFKSVSGMQNKVMSSIDCRFIYLFMIKYLILNHVVKCDQYEDINLNQDTFLFQKFYSCPSTEENPFCMHVIGNKMCDTTIGKICDRSCGFCARGKKKILKET